jgi:hypothetical protein
VAVALLVPSPLLGPPSWEAVADELRLAGVAAEVARLTPPHDAPHPWWAHAAGELVAIARRSGGEVVLVGHSGAGPRLAAFGASIAEAGTAVSGYVFVDAGLPVAGRAPSEVAPPELVEHLDRLTGDDGLLPPWCEWWGEGLLEALVPDPVARHHLEAACWPVPRSLFDEVSPVPERWPDAPCCYLRCSDGYEEDALEAERRGWLCHRRAGSHLDPVTDPGGVVGDLLVLARDAAVPLG